jgi:hypothetical protein
LDPEKYPLKPERECQMTKEIVGKSVEELGEI